jgi:DNA invertase Pin-like site-specific DNA recombinase
MEKNTKKSKRGRKQFGGRKIDDVVQKFKDVWKKGGTDSEAILIAEVSRTAYYAFLEKHPELVELRDILRDHPKWTARNTIVENLDKPDHAWRYMEGKTEEFNKNKQQPTVSIVNNLISERLKANIAEIKQQL